MRYVGLVAGIGLILAGSQSATGTSGDITITIMDLYGNGVAPGDFVKGDMWGVSRPKGGGAYSWHHIVKPAVAAGAGSSVTWTAAEVDAEVGLANNNFWIAVNAWGGSPWANSQIMDSKALWSTFFAYDQTLDAKNWDVSVITGGGFPGTPSATGIAYSLDLGTATMTDSWAHVNVTYEGCARNCQPVISAETKAYMIAAGYAFDETRLASSGLLRITNAAAGYDEVFSARSNGAGGYIEGLSTLGCGTTTYDGVHGILDVQIDFASLGLSPGDTYFCKPEFIMAGPADSDYTNLVTRVTSGYVGHTLDIQTVVSTAVPEPLTIAGLVLGVGSLVGYVRKRRA